MPRSAHRPRTRAALVAALLLLACCAADREARTETVAPEDPPTRVTRVGVPVLMDLPLIGFLFRRTTVVR